MARDGHTNRVVWKYGKASDYQCVDCGDQAQDWSQIHGTKGDNDPVNFLPRCRKCHRAYDQPIHDEAAERRSANRWTLEAREAQRKWMNANRDKVSAAQWTPEKREAKRQETVTKNKEPISDKRRQRLSESHKGQPSPRKGLSLSEEQKAKISASLTGSTWSPARRATYEKNGQPSSRKGTKLTDEQRRKVSEGKMGKPWSPARRAAHERRWGKSDE